MEEILSSLISLKEYVNNMKDDPNPNLYKVGYHNGIIVSEIDRIQTELEDILSAAHYEKNATKVKTQLNG